MKLGVDKQEVFICLWKGSFWFDRNLLKRSPDLLWLELRLLLVLCGVQ